MVQCTRFDPSPTLTQSTNHLINELLLRSGAAPYTLLYVTSAKRPKYHYASLTPPSTESSLRGNLSLTRNFLPGPRYFSSDNFAHAASA
jgi:hypothetical protein